MLIDMIMALVLHGFVGALIIGLLWAMAGVKVRCS